MSVYAKRNAVRKNLEKEPEKTPELGLWDKTINVAKKSVSATAGAVVGGILGSIIPGLGTLVGAAVGAVIGRAVEATANYIFGVDEKNTPAAEQPVKSSMFDVLEPVLQGATNTADMTLKMGGSKANPSKATQLIEAPAPTPPQASGAIPLAQAFFNKTAGHIAQPEFTARSPHSNPAATPRLTAAPAA